MGEDAKMTQTPMPAQNATIRVYCECGAPMLMDFEDDETIFQRCDACDEYIVEGTYTLSLIIRKPTKEENAT